MNNIAKVFRMLCAVLAITLLAGFAAAAETAEPVTGLQSEPTVNISGLIGTAEAQVTNIVYDSTNQAVSAGTSTTDLNAVFGDQLLLAGGVGEDVSVMKFAVFCSGSSTGALVSATETIRFYDLDNAGAYIGGFSVGLGALNPGFYSLYTTTGIEGAVTISLPSANLLVTQQLSNVVGASRMGTVLSYANAPAVGATNDAYYASSTTLAAGWYVSTGQTISNLLYELETVQSVVPTESSVWGSIKAEYR